MNIRRFGILAAATAVMLVLAIVATVRTTPPARIIGDREPAFPKLVERINDVGAIEIKTRKHHFTIKGEGDQWGIVEKKNYRVPFAKVRDFVREAAELRLVEGKTRQKDRYGRLEVDEPEGEKSEARQFTVYAKNGEILAQGYIGRRKYFLYADGRAGTYVRRGGDQQAWLAEGEVNLGRTAPQWLDRLVFEFPVAEVRRYLITHPDGAKVAGQRNEPRGKVSLDNVPEGRRFRTDNEADRLALVVEKFEFEDIFPAPHIEWTGERHIAEYETFDGVIITFEVKTFPKPENASVSAEPPRFGRVKASLAADLPADKRAEAQKRVDEINAKVKDWEYKLEELDGLRTTKTMEDMLEPERQS
ncbi:MAG: DUF4340 domain-containing protein [Alphaproteobacteria bacterium]|nr:DUF4340 domain-containing protein [Alphaproteobacteria bacterium]